MHISRSLSDILQFHFNAIQDAGTKDVLISPSNQSQNKKHVLSKFQISTKKAIGGAVGVVGGDVCMHTRAKTKRTL